MSALNLTKVAVGCESVEVLAARLTGRAIDGETYITTRYKPTRAAEVIGGSLFWILKHRLVVRQRIVGFAEGVNDQGRPACLIRLEARLVPVRARPKRAHQGWRYLAGNDAPPDLAGDTDVAEMPAEMVSELAGLALL